MKARSSGWRLEEGSSCSKRACAASTGGGGGGAAAAGGGGGSEGYNDPDFVGGGLDSAGRAAGLEESEYIRASTEYIGYNDPDLAIAGEHPEASQRLKEYRQALVKALLSLY